MKMQEENWCLDCRRGWISSLGTFLKPFSIITARRGGSTGVSRVETGDAATRPQGTGRPLPAERCPQCHSEKCWAGARTFTVKGWFCYSRAPSGSYKGRTMGEWMCWEEGHTLMSAVSHEGSVPVHSDSKYLPSVVRATHTPRC